MAPPFCIGRESHPGLPYAPTQYVYTHTSVVSTTVNRNTTSPVIGLALPALVIGMGSTARERRIKLGWLFGMIVGRLLLLIPAKGMTRMGGAEMIIRSLLFVVVHLLWPNIERCP